MIIIGTKGLFLRFFNSVNGFSVSVIDLDPSDPGLRIRVDIAWELSITVLVGITSNSECDLSFLPFFVYFLCNDEHETTDRSKEDDEFISGIRYDVYRRKGETMGLRKTCVKNRLSKFEVEKEGRDLLYILTLIHPKMKRHDLD